MSLRVDVNTMVYNCVDMVGATINGVLAQTWPEVAPTLFDYVSTGGTLAIAAISGEVMEMGAAR